MTLWVRWSFSATIFVGAFLLFQVQPLMARFILPWFGGAPAVWTTCMFFYQSLLVLGYLYAHLLRRFAPLRWQLLLQGVLIASALLVLPIEPAAGWRPAGNAFPARHIALLLGATVGLPYLMLSATSPLLQAWFSQLSPGKSPYGLYALANFGSLLALLTYPLLIEPCFELKMQSELWSWAFICFAGLQTLCGLALWRKERLVIRQEHRTEERGGEREEAEDIKDMRRQSEKSAGGMSGDRDGFRSDRGERPPSGVRRLLWLVLTATGSLMLLATTNMVCQDIAVVPFLWIVPLSLYLLSFIVCFGRVQWYQRSVWSLLTLLILCLLSSRDALEGYGYGTGIVGEITLYFAALFAACMLCHGETVRLRPAPEHLTEFYLLIGTGGALGGLLAGLAAPRIFNDYAEWTVGIAACWGIALMVLIQDLLLGYRRLKLACLLFAALATLVVVISVVSSEVQPLKVIAQSRSFYGVVAVCERNVGDEAAHQFLMRHGTTHHGGQFADPAKRRWATAYYGKESGVGRALEYLREGPSVRMGAIGLGVGALAVYARPGDEYRFYEINPEVLRLARQHFTYLGDCLGTCEVVLGDGRVSLEGEPPRNFDILVLDAFNSDAIPVHLLTEEAFALYRRHLAPGGIIAVHITNRHLNLVPVVQGLAEHFGLSSRLLSTPEHEEQLIFDADWMLVSENVRFLSSIPVMPTLDPGDLPRVTLWTDHHSSLLPLLKTVYGGS